MKIAIVEWVDSFAHSGWCPKDSLPQATKCISAGIILEEGNSLKVINSLSNETSDANLVMSIPKVAVTRIRYLRVK